MTDAKNADTEQLEDDKGFHFGRGLGDDQNVEDERLARGDDLDPDTVRDRDDAGMDGPHHGLAEPDMAESDLADDPVDRQVIDRDTTAPAGPRHDVVEPSAPEMPAAPTASGTGTRSVDLIAAGDVEQYRNDWRTVQHGFVDDPAAAVRDADALVGRLFDTITTRINEQRTALSAHRSDDAAEHTEQLRQALRDYRTMFEQLLPAQRP
jgi:hypothetical protein